MSAVLLVTLALLALGILATAMAGPLAAGGREEEDAKSEVLRSNAPAPRDLRPARTLLTAAAAVLLYLTLFPSQRHTPGTSTLTVLTADWQQAIDAIPAHSIALPEAGSVATTRTPDLATALRDHPGARLEVIGRGLAARDRDAARGRVVRLVAAPLPEGITELEHPRTLVPGAAIDVRGRVEGAAAQAHLLDPAGRSLASTGIDDVGRFALTTPARASGPLLLSLRIDDVDGNALHSAPVPVQIHTPPPLRLLLLAGAPNPELKYLRRWAEDAGLALDSRIALAPGVMQGDDTLQPDAAALRGADLVILDERAFAELDADGRTLLFAAVRDGLGVLLRLTAVPETESLEALVAVGFSVEQIDVAREVRAQAHPGTELSRLPLEVRGTDAASLLQNRDGEPLALWRPFGQGRIAVIWMTDSYRLQLADHPSTHAALWSGIAGTLARPGDDASIHIEPATPWAGERVRICGLGDVARHAPGRIVDATLHAPDQTVDALLVTAECAAWWPRQAGLHRLVQAGREARWLYVHDPAREPARFAATVGSATDRMQSEPLRRADHEATPMPGNPWPWALALLIVLGILWLTERRAATLQERGKPR